MEFKLIVIKILKKKYLSRAVGCIFLSSALIFFAFSVVFLFLFVLFRFYFYIQFFCSNKRLFISRQTWATWINAECENMSNFNERVECTGKGLVRFSHWIFLTYIPIRERERTETSRATHGDLEDDCLHFLSQYNATGDGNWRAVPANSAIIRPVGVLWIFKLASRPWHGNVFPFFFSILYAQFRDWQFKRHSVYKLGR